MKEKQIEKEKNDQIGNIVGGVVMYTAILTTIVIGSYKLGQRNGESIEVNGNSLNRTHIESLVNGPGYIDGRDDAKLFYGFGVYDAIEKMQEEYMQKRQETCIITSMDSPGTGGRTHEEFYKELAEQCCPEEMDAEEFKRRLKRFEQYEIFANGKEHSVPDPKLNYNGFSGNGKKDFGKNQNNQAPKKNNQKPGYNGDKGYFHRGQR